MQGIPVTCIKAGAFQETYGTQFVIENIIISEGVITIEDNAFTGCRDLLSVSLPNTLEVIGVSAFYACEALERVSFGDNLMDIGVSAFHGCFSLTEIDLPHNLRTIQAYAFAETALTTVVIPPNVEEIGAASFYFNSNLISFSFSSSVKTMGTSIFLGENINIQFIGTIEEFLSIEKEEYCLSSIIGTIYCSDGEISCYAGELTYIYYEIIDEVEEPTG